MKVYTSLEQSIKLAKILPIQSADMYYPYFGDNKWGETARFGEALEYSGKKDIPCWSLPTLLSVIPKHIKDYNVLRIDISENEFAIWYDEIGYGVNNDLPNITTESAVDACVEMILKLSQLPTS